MEMINLNNEVTMTLKEITDLLGVRHDKAMLKVVELQKEQGFGSLSKMDTQYKSGKGRVDTIETYVLNKKQAIAAAARLNNTALMAVVNRLEELEAQKPKLSMKDMALMVIKQEEEKERLQLELTSAIQTKHYISQKREATAMNTASQAVKKANKLEKELDKSKEYCTIKRMQMLTHGQTYNWRLLKSTGAEMDVEPIEVFDANYGSVKAYHQSVWLEAYAIDLTIISGE